MTTNNRTILTLRQNIRKQVPLIHHITNYVVMNLTANVTLALGASPVMAHAEEEVAEMTGFASALVLNIGTLSKSWISAMYRAAEKAVERGIPIVLDPVGSGATALRTSVARTIIDTYSPTIVRGNSSEIRSLIATGSKTRGVDSMHSLDDVRTDAIGLAADKGIVIAITGPIDFITDGAVHYEVRNGHPLLSRVTGTGCSATSVIGAFAAVASKQEGFCLAAAGALGYYGLAAEMAAAANQAPGSFGISVLDWLYLLDDEQFLGGLRVEAVE